MGHRFNEDTVGVYVDSWWGQYAVARAVGTAVDLGWQPEDQPAIVAAVVTKLHAGRFATLEQANDARRYAGMAPINDVYEDVYDDHLDTELEFALDDAVDWLNLNADDGFWWGWRDGDFGLWPQADE